MIKRYQTKEIAAIFNDEAKIKKWLFVERIVASVEESAGIIPRGLSRNLLKVVVKPERVQAIEKVTNHDVIAFLQAVREKLGEKEGRWLHFGLTSYDLVDTAFVLSIIEAIDVLMKDISRLKRILKKAALRYRQTP